MSYQHVPIRLEGTLLLFYWIWPLLLALVPIVLKVERLRFAFLWIVIGYVVSALGAAIIPAFLTMMESSTGDPKMVAGQVSQSLVTYIILMVINIPLAFLIFWGFRKLKGKS